MPVYVVEVQGTNTKRLVDAPNQASARGHVARQVISTKVVGVAEAFKLAKEGSDIETVGEEPAADPGTTIIQGSRMDDAGTHDLADESHKLDPDAPRKPVAAKK